MPREEKGGGGRLPGSEVSREGRERGNRSGGGERDGREGGERGKSEVKGEGRNEVSWCVWSTFVGGVHCNDFEDLRSGKTCG